MDIIIIPGTYSDEEVIRSLQLDGLPHIPGTSDFFCCHQMCICVALDNNKKCLELLKFGWSDFEKISNEKYLLKNNCKLTIHRLDMDDIKQRGECCYYKGKLKKAIGSKKYGGNNELNSFNFRNSPFDKLSELKEGTNKRNEKIGNSESTTTHDMSNASKVQEGNSVQKLDEQNHQCNNLNLKNININNSQRKVAESSDIPNENGVQIDLDNAKKELRIIQSHTDKLKNKEQMLSKQIEDIDSRINLRNRELIEIEQRVTEIQTKADETQKDADKKIDIANQLIKMAEDELNRQRGILQEANEIELKICAKIESIKQNAADFIAEMALISPLFSNSKTTEPHIIESLAVDTNNHLTSFQALQDHLIKNIEAIGVHDEYSSSLCLLLVASYRKMQPLLLAGPKAFEIANAFSESIFAQRAAVLDCYGDPCPEGVQKLNACKSKVVIIRHSIQSRWADYLPELLSINDKFVIVVHPFIEDLLIEPKSLYSYMMPVFTEILFSGEQARPIEPALIDFNIGRAASDPKRKVRDLKNNRLYNGFLFNRMNLLFKDYCFVSQEADEFDEIKLRTAFILMVEFPYAYVTSQIQKLGQYLSNDNKLIDIELLSPIKEYFDEIFE